MVKANLDLMANTDRALRSINGFASKASASLRSVESSFNVLGAAAGAAVGFLAGRALVGGIQAVTEAAGRQEDAVNNLNTALKVSGDFSQQASQDLQAFASSIQDTTKFGDELVLEQLALTKAFGASNEQAKLLTEASVELAAATGKSLQEATQQVSKTLGGFAGELGEVNPAIKELTAEQLKAGEAARILIEQYGGSAAGQVNSFNGVVEQTSNLFGDLQESLGATITKNPAVIRAVKLLGDTFKSLISSIDGNQEGIGKFISSIVSFSAKAAGPVIRSSGLIFKAFEGIVLGASLAVQAITNLLKLSLRFKIVRQVVTDLFDGFNLLRLGVQELFEVWLSGIENILRLASNIPGVGGKFDSAASSINDFRKSVEDSNNAIKDSILSGENAIDTGGIEESLDSASKRALNLGDEIGGFFKNITDGVDEVADAVEDKLKPLQDIQFSGNVGDVSGGADQSPAAQTNPLVESLTKAFEGVGDKVAAGFLAGIVNGASGAESFITGALSTGATAFVESIAPGAGAAFGPAISSFTKALAKGPEFVEAQVDEFAKAFPVVIKNIAEAIPAVVRALADNTDEIVIALVEGMPEVAAALAVEIPLALADPGLWERVAIAIRDRIAQRLNQLGDNFGATFRTFNAAFAETTGKFFNALLTFPEKLSAFDEVFKKSFTQAGTNFSQAFLSPFSSFFASLGRTLEISISNSFVNAANRLVDIINRNIRSLDPTSGGGGGVLGALSRGDIGSAASQATGGFFADGGIVPPGFANDTFPANLTSGEEVVSVADRSQILSGQQQTLNLLGSIAEQLSAPMVVSTTAEVDGEAFADIILQLNRRNERLA